MCDNNNRVYEMNKAKIGALNMSVSQAKSSSLTENTITYKLVHFLVQSQIHCPLKRLNDKK